MVMKVITIVLVEGGERQGLSRRLEEGEGRVLLIRGYLL